jgi:hypothetical protein
MPLFILLFLAYGGPHWSFPPWIWFVGIFLTFFTTPTVQLKRS